MNSSTGQMSRRAFLISGAATTLLASVPVRFKAGSAIDVHMIGWGQHGRRFLDAVRAGQISVVSILDSNPGRASLGAGQLGAIQHRAPSCHSSASSFLKFVDGTNDNFPLVLTSPPDTWPSLLSLCRMSKRTLIAHHKDCFHPAGVALLRKILKSFPAQIFPMGFDPRFPRLSISAFFDFARSRGATATFAHLEHDGWSPEELSSFMFDFLSCSWESDARTNTFQHFAQGPFPDSPSKSFAACRFLATGGDLNLETTMLIAGPSDHNWCKMEGVEAFRAFTRTPHDTRLRTGERILRLFDHAAATLKTMPTRSQT
jgi:hypothetical protein